MEKINHQRIDHNPEKGFTLVVMESEKPEYTVTGIGSLGSFLNSIEKDLLLAKPVPNSKFKSLFQTSHSEGYLMPAVDDY